MLDRETRVTSPHRVVVTGMGVVSSLGCDLREVTAALRHGASGLQSSPEMRDLGLSCCVSAPVRGWDAGKLERAWKRSMSDTAEYAVAAAVDALSDAGLAVHELPKRDTSIVIGTAYGGISEVSRIDRILSTRKNPTRAGAVGLLKLMHSTASGNLASCLGVHGRSYSLSSGFASGTDCIGNGYELVRHGMARVCLAGASEEDTRDQLAAYYNNWGALPTDYNDRPTEACRPYDADRQGFVPSEGAGVVVLESLEHARQRGARIYAEIVGYGSANDGDDMFRASGGGLQRALRQALAGAAEHEITTIDYVNTHGTGTPLGDRVEVDALRQTFPQSPLISSTKGQSGHAMGAAGALEAVYSLLMLEQNFVAPTVNLVDIADECQGVHHVQTVLERPLDVVLSFSVGFGGTNAAVICRKLK